jgi:hypothetical protein
MSDTSNTIELRLRRFLNNAANYPTEEDADPRLFTRASLRSILARLSPEEVKLVRRCAIPRWFDQAILALLSEQSDTTDRLVELLSSFSFVRRIDDNRYAYHQDTRDILLEDWHSLQPVELGNSHQRLVEYYIQLMQRHLAAQPHEVTAAVQARNEALYHSLARDGDKVWSQFTDLFTTTLQAGYISQAEALVSIAQSAADDGNHTLPIDNLLAQLNTFPRADAPQVEAPPPPPTIFEPNEYNLVELPLIQQLTSMGWRHIAGDTNVPAFTNRSSFREVLLFDTLRAKLRELNRHYRKVMLLNGL